jgi:hypothetical protein
MVVDDPQHDRPTPAIMQLEVINHNDFPIDDFFDGVPVSYPKDVVVTVTPDMALHCFGYPGDKAEMALHMAKRYGWSGRDYLIQQGEREPLYKQLAAKIEIKPVYFDLVRRDRDAPILADNGEDEDTRMEPVGSGDTGTRTGKRKRTPARLAVRAPRVKAGRDTADVKLRTPRR